jgi:hypothetical protein
MLTSSPAVFPNIVIAANLGIWSKQHIIRILPIELCLGKVLDVWNGTTAKPEIFPYRMRKKGLEPLRPFGHQLLRLARLPIPPLPLPPSITPPSRWIALARTAPFC